MRSLRKTLEDRRVSLSLLQSFLLGLPRVFTVTATSTLFFAHAGADSLPVAYALSAGLVALVGLGFGKLEKSAGLRTAGTVALLFLAIALAAGRLLLVVPAVALPLAFGLLLLGEAEANLTNITFWSVANRLFSVREAGRLFGFISTGEVLASILGGLAVPALTRALGPESLLLISAGLHLLSAWTLDTVADLSPGDFGAAPGANPEGEGRAPPTSLWSVLRQPYVMLAGGLLCLNVLVFFFVDNAFFHAATALMGGADGLPRLLGVFFTALGTGNLLFKVLVSGKWRGWFGLRDALLSTPASLASIAASALLLWAVAGPEYALVAVVVLKVMERLFIEGVNSPTYYSLFQPLPVDVRSRAQNALETQVAQVAAAAGGGVLLLLTRGLGFQAVGITAVTLGLLLVWAYLAWRIGHEYVRVLGSAVSQGRIHSREVRIDEGTVKLLLELLDSPHPPRVVYSLQLLKRQPSLKVDAALLRLLRHPDETVVQAACDALLARRTQGADAALLQCLEPEPQPGEDLHVRAHWLQALAQLSPGIAEAVLVRHLNAQAPTLRAAAVVALGRFGGASGRDQSSMVLEVLCASRDPAQRVAAAWAIGQLDDVPSVNRLLLLMQDGDSAVRLEALRAAGKRNNPILFPSMLLYLQRGEFRAECTAALVHLGPAVVHQLLGHFRAARPDQRELYVPVMGRIGGPAVEKTLVRELQPAARDLRLDMLRALDLAGHVPLEAEASSWRALFEEELSTFAELLAARRDVAGLAAPLLHEALDAELAKSSRRAVLLFGLVHHGRLKQLGIQLRRSDLEDAPLGLELLENLLGPAEAARVLPLFEQLPVEEKLQRLRPGVPLSAPEPHRALLALLDPGATQHPKWLQSCAAVAAEEAGVEAPRATPEARERFEWVRLLASVRFLSGITGERLATLSARCHLRAARAGMELLAPGAPTSSLWLLREGELSVPMPGAPPEALHGGMALLAPGPSRWGLGAARASILLELTHDDLFELFARDFEVAWNVLCRLCEWLREEDAGTGPRGATGGRAAARRGGRLHKSGVELEEPEESTHVERLLGLKCSRLFSSLGMEVLSDIAHRVTERFLEPGEPLITQGEHGASMFAVVKGQLRVHRGEDTLALLEESAVVGELSAILPGPRTASLTATRFTHVLVLDRALLHEIARSHPEVLRLLLQVVVRRLEASAAPRAQAA